MLPEVSGVDSGPSIWALLVGIDRYATQNHLRGCVNDVMAFQRLLIDRYDVPDDHIRVLTNEQATRANILQEFQAFLINSHQIKRGDQILFHYSGHGSQMPAGPQNYEPDGLNETLVPYDSRTPGVYDIPDKTLAVLLNALAEAQGDQITVILDSCHSGSATRAIPDPALVAVRRVPADDRIPPNDLDSDLLTRHRASRRGTGPSGWATPSASYVLLAGCRDREESNEYLARVEGDAIAHGALTFFTMQVLHQLPPGATYADLHERVAALVNANFPSQTPQCEGDRHRQVLGTVRKNRDPFFVVQQVHGDTLTLGGGLVHGLRPGTQLAVYPPDVRLLSDLPAEPLAIAEVAMVGAANAQAHITNPLTEPLPEHARALISRQVYEGLRQLVALEAGDDIHDQQSVAALRQALRTAAPNGQESPYLQVVDNNLQQADLRVKVESGRFTIYNSNLEPLVLPEDIEDQGLPGQPGVGRGAVRTCQAMENIARYRTLMNLKNEGASRLQGGVKLGLRRYLRGQPPTDLAPGSVGAGGELTLYYDPDHEDQNLYVVDVINETGLSVYLNVFTLSPDYSITRLYPQAGQQEAIAPNRREAPYPIGLQRGTTQLRIWLPPGWDASQDYIKAIVTTAPVDLEILDQNGVSVPPPTRSTTGTRGNPTSPLEQLIDAIAFGSGTRFAGPAQTVPEDDWAVAELPIKTVRKYQTTTLGVGEARVPLSEEFTLVKPPGFVGTATVTTLGLATRGDQGDPNMRPPPGLDRFPDLFQPVGRSAVRSLGSSGLVIGFDIDEASRQLITTNNPMRVELAAPRGGEAMEIFPVIFDGEDYLLAGYGTEEGNAVDIVSLPPPVAIAGPDGAPTTRGIGRTLRLFIYKRLGRYTSDLGLRRADLNDGSVVYSDVQRAQFQAGEKVALFVHGFLSDSRWMVQHPARFLYQEVLQYDHLLTWDYETFGTGVQDNGEQLALALQQRCGLGPDDGVTLDVYAHSMGTLVSRCMIELYGGNAFTDRLVLAGPPNQGSTLATTGRGLVFLITSFLNRASVAPVIGLANWVVKQLYEQGVGLADLAVDSAVLRKLNSLHEPSNVPYLVLAGENLADAEATNRLNRLAHKVLDAGLDVIFGEQNDIAVGLSSMKDLRGGAYPNLKVEVLPCDHFHYYVTPEGQQAIRNWRLGN